MYDISVFRNLWEKNCVSLYIEENQQNRIIKSTICGSNQQSVWINYSKHNLNNKLHALRTLSFPLSAVTVHLQTPHWEEQKRKETSLQSVTNNFSNFQTEHWAVTPFFWNELLKISNCCFKDIAKDEFDGVTRISLFIMDSVLTIFKLSGLMTNNSHSFHQQPFSPWYKQVPLLLWIHNLGWIKMTHGSADRNSTDRL